MCRFSLCSKTNNILEAKLNKPSTRKGDEFTEKKDCIFSDHRQSALLGNHHLYSALTSARLRAAFQKEILSFKIILKPFFLKNIDVVRNLIIRNFKFNSHSIYVCLA